MKKFFLGITFRYWCIWSKIYRSLQLFFCKDYEEKKKNLESNIKTAQIRAFHSTWRGNQNSPVFSVDELKEFWNYMCNKYRLTWKADTWYMLCDVISDPVMTFVSGVGDCDDFASSARYAIGDFIRVGDERDYKVFEFQGIYSIIFSYKLGGHALAVWRYKDHWIVVSNHDVFCFESKEDFISCFKGIFGDFNYIGKISNDLEFLGVDKI